MARVQAPVRLSTAAKGEVRLMLSVMPQTNPESGLTLALIKAPRRSGLVLTFLAGRGEQAAESLEWAWGAKARLVEVLADREPDAPVILRRAI